MNIIFWILVVFGIILIWSLLAAFAFRPLGLLVIQIINDVIETIKNEEVNHGRKNKSARRYFAISI